MIKKKPKIIELQGFTINEDINCYKKYLKETEAFKKIKFTDLKTLSQDIKEHKTPEIYSPNDFYYNALTLKKYAELSEEFIIKASIEHGPGYSTEFWLQDVNAPFGNIIVPSEQRIDVYKKAGINKNFYKIGPVIYYAKSILTSEEIQKEKERLGKNALVFPAHATHYIDVKFDINEFIEQLKFETKDFDSVRICLYWKNILNGEAEPYLKAGFECVTSGHMYSPLFLPRQRALIEIADVTISNSVGSQIPNSLVLNTPHYLIDTDLKYTTKSKNQEVQTNMKQIEAFDQDKVVKQHYQLFSKMNFEITREQQALGNYYYGLNELKTPEELRNILIEQDINYEENLLINLGQSRAKINSFYEVKHVNYIKSNIINEWGKAFLYNEKIYIAIDEKNKYKVLNFLNTDLYKELVELKYFPEVKFSDIKIKDFAFVLEYEKLQYSNSSEWSYSMMKDATKFLLKIRDICLKYGYSLSSGSLTNVLFKNNNPIFINMEAIVNKDVSEEFFKDFKETCLVPLILFVMGEEYLVKSILSNNFIYQERLVNDKQFYNSEAIKKIFEKFMYKEMKINPIKVLTKKDTIRYVLNKLITIDKINEFIKDKVITMDFEEESAEASQISKLVKEYSTEATSFCCLGGGIGQICSYLEKNNPKLQKLINIDYDYEKIDNSYLKIKQSNFKTSSYVLNFMSKNEKSSKNFKSDIVYVPEVNSLLKKGFSADFICNRLKEYSRCYVYIQVEDEEFKKVFKNYFELINRDKIGENIILIGKNS